MVRVGEQATQAVICDCEVRNHECPSECPHFPTLFTSAEGIERLWEVSTPLLEAPPPVRLYAPGSWGPNAIHQLVAPHAWRLPFERAWRDPNPIGA